MFSFLSQLISRTTKSCVQDTLIPVILAKYVNIYEHKQLLNIASRSYIYHTEMCVCFLTRMHSIGMRTTRSLPYQGESLSGGVCLAGLCPGGLCPVGVSVQEREGVSVSGPMFLLGVSVWPVSLGRDPPGQRPTGQRPPGQRPPWTETPWTETPLDRDPLDRDPLDKDPPEGTWDQRQSPPSPVDRQMLLKTLPCLKLRLRAVINLERNVNIVLKMTFAMGECRNLSAVCSKLEIIFVPIELFVNNPQNKINISNRYESDLSYVTVSFIFLDVSSHVISL